MAPKKKAPAPPKGQHFDSLERGISIYYEVAGPVRKEWQGEKEETVFMLLGSTADLRKTADQQYINQSVGYFKVVAYDHRNTGRTTAKDEPCTMADYADDAAALIQGIIPEKLPVYVIGISFGGMVAQHLALRHPHLIKKLVLCCCPTGGEGGMSHPIHEWYAPDMSIEDRVEQRLFKANTDRNAEWKEKSKSEFDMSMSILKRDEGIGKDEPFRQEGITRQLEARRNHNTWDSIGELGMDVLCCGSPKDNITPVKLIETLAARIGDNCEKKLDFDWGHPFVAADIAAMLFINEWLRKPLRKPLVAKSANDLAATSVPAALIPAASDSVLAAAPAAATEEKGGQNWEIVGGGAKGGIIVRAGQATSSAEQADRLSTGALVRELELHGDRLHYRLLKGIGPSEGWISIKLKDKDLAILHSFGVLS